MTATYRQITGPDGLLAHCADFTGNTLSGRNVRGYCYGTGRLQGNDLDAFEDAQGSLAYVVKSYGTPIAWVLQDGTSWFVSSRFSVTTSKQQTYVGAWLNRAQVSA